MKYEIKYRMSLVAMLGFIPLLLGLKLFGNEDLSPMAVTANTAGTKLYVAESSARRVDVVDIAKGTIIKAIRLPQDPLGLVLDRDAKTLYATGDGPQGKLMTIDLGKGRVTQTLTVGHTLMSPVIDPSGNFIYLCERFNDLVIVVDLARQQVVAKIPVKRQPVACGLSPDGALLFVANHLPSGVADQGKIAAEVQVIDTAARRVVKSIVLPNGSTSLRGLCVSPDGLHVYVTHLLGRYTMPTTQLERGWMNTNALTIIDAKGLSLLSTVLLDDLGQGAANPWAIACSDDGRTLCLTHAGTHEVSVIDRWGMQRKLDRVSRHEYAEDPALTPEGVPNTLSFLGPLRQRRALAIEGPRGCTIAGPRLIVSGYFSDNLELIDLAPGNGKNGRVIALGARSNPGRTRQGEMLFNDARLCFQQWQSCASCHPDSRVDGLNWDLMNDGVGNPKNTKSMLLAHKTPPVMSLGIRKEAETAVRAGIKYIQFAECPEEKAQAIDQYLRSMRPVASPHRRGNRLSDPARRGKEIFKQAGCVQCHSGSLLTQLGGFNLGTGTGMDRDKPIDTPTLVEAWRTAPYLHDGRAATIMDVLTTFNFGDQHGRTSHLSRQQLEDLAEYVLSQ